METTRPEIRLPAEARGGGAGTNKSSGLPTNYRSGPGDMPLSVLERRRRRINPTNEDTQEEEGLKEQILKIIDEIPVWAYVGGFILLGLYSKGIATKAVPYVIDVVETTAS